MRNALKIFSITVLAAVILAALIPLTAQIIEGPRRIVRVLPPLTGGGNVETGYIQLDSNFIAAGLSLATDGTLSVNRSVFVTNVALSSGPPWTGGGAPTAGISTITGRFDAGTFGWPSGSVADQVYTLPTAMPDATYSLVWSPTDITGTAITDHIWVSARTTSTFTMSTDISPTAVTTFLYQYMDY